MLCLITCEVRSENGYGFLRPGLKTGVENGIFGLKLGLDLEMRAAHPHQNSKEYPPGSYSTAIKQQNGVRFYRYSDWLPRYPGPKLKKLKIYETRCVNNSHGKNISNMIIS